MSSPSVASREPLVTVGGIVALVSAVVALVVAFGVDLSEGQIEAILGLVAVLAPIIVALLARGKVTPWKYAVEVIDQDGRPVHGPSWKAAPHPDDKAGSSPNWA